MIPGMEFHNRKLPMPLRFILTLSACLIASVAVSEPYRLTLGDRIEILHSGAEAATQAMVDSDGQVRLPDLGGVDVAGLTLDEASAAVSEAMQSAGLFVAPRVNLSVEAYAPLVVAGDVVAPGPVAYAPGLTVAAAVALVGGPQNAGLTRNELARAQVELEGSLDVAALEIAAATVRLARFEAALADSDFQITDTRRARLPSRSAGELKTLIDNEKALLAADRDRQQALERFWSEEIETIEAQIGLFEERIAVQQEIAATTSDALTGARDLEARGLQTNQRMAAVAQRAAEAQSKVLELQSARIAATQAVSAAERERVRSQANWRQEALEGVQRATLAMETAALRHARLLRQLALLTGGQGLSAEAVEHRYAVLSPRPDRATEGAAPDMVLLPGDTLIVTIAARDPDADG